LEDKNHQIGLKNELLRKAIHLGSVVIPISYYFIEKNIVLIVVGIGTVLMILLDLFRKISPGLNNFYTKILGIVLRRNEFDTNKHFFTGGTFYAIGMFLTLLFFKREIAAPALLIMILCDTVAALIGKKFGKHNLWNKSIEGSSAFFATGLIIVFVTPKITTGFNEYIFAVIALFVTTIIEALPVEIDDNISIPVSFGIIYTLLLYFF
jgi:dolichol kinase